MARTGTLSGASRGLIHTPARRSGTFAIRPANRTAASTALARVGDFKPGKRQRSGGWQSDALTYYETLPPVGFVMDFKANTVAACDFNVEQDGVPVENNEQIDRLMDSLVGPRGGNKEVWRRAALLVEVTGEAYLVGTPVQDESDAVFWEFLSVEEIVLPDGQTTTPGSSGYKRDPGNGEKYELPSDTFIARFWRSDARKTWLPHCGLRRCLSTCRELVLLGQMTEAIIASRLPMGLLLLPDTMRHLSPLHRTDPAASSSETGVGDEGDFMDDLLAHLEEPISDFGSASTFVPLVIQANREDLAAIKTVDLARGLDSYAAGLREEMYGRLAVGMDVPPEIIEGKGGLNHWTGFNVDNEFLYKHVQPVGELVADFITYAYLRPMLEIEGMDVEAASAFSVVFDASPLANNQDDDQKARELWDLLLISDRAVVEKQGWDPEAVMPDEEERTRRLVEKMVLSKVVSLSDEGAKFLGLDPKWFAVADPRRMPPSEFGQPPLEAIPGVGDVPAEGNSTPEVIPSQPGQPPEPSPAEQSKPGSARPGPPQRSQAAGVLVAKLGTRADAAYDRAMEIAGNRILNASKRVPAFRDRFAGVDAEHIPTRCSSVDLAAMGLTVDACTRGAWQRLAEHAHRLLGEHIAAHGIPASAATSAAAQITAQFVNDLDDWLQSSFHQAGRVTDGFKVPVGIVVAAVERASQPAVRVA